MAWFLVPYRRRTDDILLNGIPVRYCAMDDFTDLIRADGGAWSESECLGNYAVAKVVASQDTIQLMAAERDFVLVSEEGLDNPLSNLTEKKKQVVTDKLIVLGYSLDEIGNVWGNDIRNKTLRQLLRFVLTNRRKPRYHHGTNTVIFDGPIQACKSIETLDSEV